MKPKRNQDIRVHCPKCSFKRLFDVAEPAGGIIKIKCPSCKAMLELDLEHISLLQQEKRLKGYKINQ